MKFLTNKIYIILFLLTIFFTQSETYARDGKIQYTRKNISNYFIGIISLFSHIMTFYTCFQSSWPEAYRKVQSLAMKKLLYLIFFSLLFPNYQARANSTPEDMVLIKKGCFMMGTNKIHDYLAFDPNIRERPNDRERPVHKVCLDAF